MIDPNGTLRVSNSSLSNSACSTRALLANHHRLTSTEDSHAAMAGRAAHEALADYLKNNHIACALSAFEQAYCAYARKHVPGDSRLNYEDTRDILERWMQLHPIDSLPFTVDPALVEVAFELPLDSSCIACGLLPGNRHVGHIYAPRSIFRGRLDAIVTDKTTGRLWVLDHKTTSRLFLGKYTLDSQMSGYVWAARQTLNRPIAGFYINAISFAQLPGINDRERKCAKHKLPYGECRLEHAEYKLQAFTRSPATLAAWHGTACHLADVTRVLVEQYPEICDLPDVPVEGTFYGQCEWCFAKVWCEDGRNPEMVRSVFAQRPQEV